MKAYGNPALSKSISAIFPTTFAHFASLGHILVILTIFGTFSLLLCCHRDLGSVIFFFFLVGFFFLFKQKVTKIIIILISSLSPM